MGQSGSTAKGPTVTSHDKAILKLKIQRDKLTQSKKRLAIIIDKETDLAKKCIQANPPNISKAKLALRKKKRQESLLTQLEQQSDTLEQLIETIEFKLIEKDVIYGLEMGNNVLKEINKELSVEKVDKIMDETAEGVAYQNELSERLGEVLSSGEEIEVDEELRALQLQMGVIKEPLGVEAHMEADRFNDVENKLKQLPKVSTSIREETTSLKDERDSLREDGQQEAQLLPA